MKPHHASGRNASRQVTGQVEAQEAQANKVLAA
jgi:hypothetical protein